MAGKLHNYTRHTPALHYVLEAVNDDSVSDNSVSNRFYMTAEGMGIRSQDYILLREDGIIVKYKVEKIDHYCGTPDYWIALLVKCPEPIQPQDSPSLGENQR
jgi:hypothetical protein